MYIKHFSFWHSATSRRVEASTAAFNRAVLVDDSVAGASRGIKFKFTSFEQFMEEVGPRPSAKHSLDRIDNEKGYEPGNVGWRTDGEQIANRRRFGCLEVYSNAELAAELERRGTEVLKKNATDDAVYADA